MFYIRSVKNIMVDSDNIFWVKIWICRNKMHFWFKHLNIKKQIKWCNRLLFIVDIPLFVIEKSENTHNQIKIYYFKLLSKWQVTL